MSELTRKLIQHRGKHKISTLIMAVLVMLALMATAEASPVPGANPTWNGAMSVAITSSCINLYSLAIGTCPNVDQFTLQNPSDAIFGTPTVTKGNTTDYVAANQPSFAPGNQPYTGGTAFMTLNGFTFDVTSIDVPAIPTCTGSVSLGACSVEDLTLTQIDLNTTGGVCPGGVGNCGTVIVGFHSNGIGYVTGSNPGTTGSTPFTYSYTSQFNNETIPDLIAKASAGQITDSISITANGINTATVPEPMAFSLMGLGLAAIGVLGRLRRSRG
jgi:hypothetical protein